MARLLALVIGYALSSFVLKLFTVLGVGIFTYVGLTALVDGFLNLLQPMLTGLPSYILDILAIAGVPEALSIVGSALLTRASINSAKAFVGVLT
ncbi:unknown protein [Pseudomonas phage Pf3]|uniref:Head virion protein G6P n=1 Tax=Pseudomonas phage Pf3 TaxID=10872 RepID=G6P_BPPF3|nr:hypothetical protein Pf3_4 [Pseudomonas phage Pf3]YP_010774591.1 hypothetical protein QJ535_gp4 [Pseudomonas phage Pf3]P03625.1 RecName: Full=Head virion protein G6P; AltName: Full=Coat protein D; AltName: Full=G6P [Pseudomonas phage Pf3]AAA88380.1 unknown protein [Pseudomonas phage Pf3]AAA88389.1 unknown protein [Pseudomonas phage Pf3]